MTGTSTVNLNPVWKTIPEVFIERLAVGRKFADR
jgi:hypothetical protein